MSWKFLIWGDNDYLATMGWLFPSHISLYLFLSPACLYTDPLAELRSRKKISSNFPFLPQIEASTEKIKLNELKGLSSFIQKILLKIP